MCEVRALDLGVLLSEGHNVVATTEQSLIFGHVPQSESDQRLDGVDASSELPLAVTNP